MLVRDSDDGKEANQPRLQAAMIERAETMAFAGGATVFPGGRIDKADAAPHWRDRADGLHADEALAAAQIAAIREAFEETGILLARPSASTDLLMDNDVRALDPWRDRVETDAAQFFALTVEHDLRLCCDRLALFAHWIAPPGMNHRFDTLFFIARAPATQTLRQDGVEATSAVWLTPQAALAEAEAGTRRIIFPTARNLELLTLSPTVDDAIASARQRTIRPVIPGAELREGVLYYTIPDDLGYPITRVPAMKSGGV